MSEKRSKVALVTGATSGIGLAIAGRLGERGNSLFICARDADNVALTVKRLQERGMDAHGMACDVRSPGDVRAFVGVAAERYGAVGILVNNAGRSGGGPTEKVPDDVWLDIMETNLTSVFRLTREVLSVGGMLASGWGRIINIASTGGKQGVPLGAAYSASKGGVIAFTKALGKELAARGITVNAVCPGYVETPMAQAIRQRYAAAFGKSEQEIQKSFEAKIPLGRYATPEEVAGMVQYLISDDAASITAQGINVCGGLGNF